MNPISLTSSLTQVRSSCVSIIFPPRPLPDIMIRYFTVTTTLPHSRFFGPPCPGPRSHPESEPERAKIPLQIDEALIRKCEHVCRMSSPSELSRGRYTVLISLPQAPASLVAALPSVADHLVRVPSDASNRRLLREGRQNERSRPFDQQSLNAALDAPRGTAAPRMPLPFPPYWIPFGSIAMGGCTCPSKDLFPRRRTLADQAGKHRPDRGARIEGVNR